MISLTHIHIMMLLSAMVNPIAVIALVLTFLYIAANKEHLIRTHLFLDAYSQHFARYFVRNFCSD